MEDNDNPYTILGVDRNATQQQIKVAYRKLALKHHPDKQSTEEGREEATILFAKISNAYEILGDEAERQKYDQDSRLRAKAARRSNSHDHFFHHTQFHDPFSVFESVFRDEFGADFFGRGGNGMRQSAFQDPFFQGGGGMGGFGNDPFFNGGMGGSMFGNDPFFGGGMMMGGNNMFSAMNQQMNSMMNMHQNMMRQQPPLQADPYATFNNRLPQQQQQQTYVYSSTSSSNLNGRGESVTTSTTARIVNGKRQVVTERTVRKADGTVERHVDLSGDDDDVQPQQLPASQQRQALEAPPRESRKPKHQNSRSKPKRSLFHKRKRNDSSRGLSS